MLEYMQSIAEVKPNANIAIHLTEVAKGRFHHCILFHDKIIYFPAIAVQSIWSLVETAMFAGRSAPLLQICCRFAAFSMGISGAWWVLKKGPSLTLAPQLVCCSDQEIMKFRWPLQHLSKVFQDLSDILHKFFWTDEWSCYMMHLLPRDTVKWARKARYRFNGCLIRSWHGVLLRWIYLVSDYNHQHHLVQEWCSDTSRCSLPPKSWATL